MKNIFISLVLIAFLTTPILAGERHRHHNYHHKHDYHQHSVVTRIFRPGVSIQWHIGSPVYVAPPPPIVIVQPAPTIVYYNGYYGYWHIHPSSMNFCQEHGVYHLHHFHYQ